MQKAKLHLALLHEDMLNKHGELITPSVTLIDIHDIARSARTYGVGSFYIAHPSKAMRQLCQNLISHWEEGFGAQYNPNRKEALASVKIMASFDDILLDLKNCHGSSPQLVATSARDGESRTSFGEFRDLLLNSGQAYLLMLGSGWGMSEKLMKRANLILEPLKGRGDYNHLSVRSACAIMLDRILS